MVMTFISYESSDKVVAFKVCEYLESHGMKCWIAPRDIHAGEYAGEITRALKTADNLVVVCSSHASKSPHVRNEVSLAFGNNSKIIPFMLDDIDLDDSLEYYFAGKQRVFANKGLENGLQVLGGILGGESSLTEDTKEKKKFHPALWITIAVVTVLAVFFFYSIFRPHSEESISEAGISSENTEMLREESISASGGSDMSNIIDNQTNKLTGNDLDSFTGEIINGYPTGMGRYTFKKVRRIDMHDSKAREAQPSDYIIGEWENGHLIQGKWYSADGSLIEVILIGKALDPESDHIFEKCVGH